MRFLFKQFAPAIPFTPASRGADLKLWWRGDNGVTNDGTGEASEWATTTPSNSETLIQNTDTKRPNISSYNGDASLYYNAADVQVLVKDPLGTNVSMPATIYIAFANGVLPGESTLFYFAGGSFALVALDGAENTPQWKFTSASGDITGPNDDQTSALQIFVIVINGASTAIYRSSDLTTAYFSGTASSSAMSGAYLGAYGTTITPYEGNFLELIVVDGADSLSERTAMCDWLARWN